MLKPSAIRRSLALSLIDHGDETSNVEFVPRGHQDQLLLSARFEPVNSLHQGQSLSCLDYAGWGPIRSPASPDWSTIPLTESGHQPVHQLTVLQRRRDWAWFEQTVALSRGAVRPLWWLSGVQQSVPPAVSLIATRSSSTLGPFSLLRHRLSISGFSPS